MGKVVAFQTDIFFFNLCVIDEWSKFSAEAARGLRSSPDWRGSRLGCGSLQKVKRYIITESLS